MLAILFAVNSLITQNMWQLASELTLKGFSPECCRMWVRNMLDAVNAWMRTRR